jgi:hypothetical protein
MRSVRCIEFKTHDENRTLPIVWARKVPETGETIVIFLLSDQGESMTVKLKPGDYEKAAEKTEIDDIS